MALLTKEQFEELAGFHGAHCASIYMPTQRAGADVIEGQQRIVFEKHLRTVRDTLKDYGLNARAIEKYLKPAYELAENSSFWRRQSDGLAVFISEGQFEYHTLPVSFENYTYIADHYYVKPLIPLFNEDGRFFILSLTLHGAEFFEGAPHSVTEVHIKDLTPDRLEEVVGFDYEEKSLQWQSQPGSADGGGAMFHGQGRQDDKRREEVTQYFRAINKGIYDEILYDLNDPLVVACQDYMFPIYKKVNSYKNLLDDHVSGNPADMDPVLLHEKAWEKVSPVFEKKRREKQQQYEEIGHTDRTSYKLEEIVAAAINGRIDTLFLKKGAEAFGTYNPSDNSVDIEEEKNLSNASLLNLAAVKTLLQKGQVFMVEEEDMPVAESAANAIFRY